jgi:hypothetical protein
MRLNGTRGFQKEERCGRWQTTWLSSNNENRWFSSTQRNHYQIRWWTNNSTFMSQQSYEKGLKKRRPDLWVHQDNVLAHEAISMCQFLAGKQIPRLKHALYSPDLALCDFFLHQKLKSSLKGTHFQSKTSIRKRHSYLKHFHKMTLGDASRHGRFVWGCM